MRIDGAWWVCDDQMVRPVLRAHVRAADGTWVPVLFLVDSGADRTVLSAVALSELGLHGVPNKDNLEGVGGAASSIVVSTSMRLSRESGDPVLFHGDFAAFIDPKAADMSILGRDITNLFAVIVDRKQDVVCLLSGNHRYVVVDK